jgi:hypothetical protein
MTNEQLEQRVQALEKEMAELRSQLAVLSDKPAQKWWEKIGREHTPEELQTAQDANAYGRYYRVTGKEPPPDWKPGDPIPEPDYDA